MKMLDLLCLPSYTFCVSSNPFLTFCSFSLHCNYIHQATFCVPYFEFCVCVFLLKFIPKLDQLSTPVSSHSIWQLVSVSFLYLLFTCISHITVLCFSSCFTGCLFYFILFYLLAFSPLLYHLMLEGLSAWSLNLFFLFWTHSLGDLF